MHYGPCGGAAFDYSEAYHLSDCCVRIPLELRHDGTLLKLLGKCCEPGGLSVYLRAEVRTTDDTMS